MTTHYELATLDTVIFGAGKAAPGIEAWVAAPGAKGRLLGAWGTDIGRLNRIWLLRAFDSAEDMLAERERALRADDPFGCAEHLTGLAMDSYRGFDFLPEPGPGKHGPVYEFRSYHLRLGGLMPTMEKWQAALPGRCRYSQLAVAMYSLDGASRLTQIWPYESLAARAKARAQSVADGAWPPKGGPDFLLPEMTSAIAMSLPFSPMQ